MDWRKKAEIFHGQTKVIAARLPVELLNGIDEFKGCNTYHLERAMRLYVRILGTGS